MILLLLLCQHPSINSMLRRSKDPSFCLCHFPSSCGQTDILTSLTYLLACLLVCVRRKMAKRALYFTFPHKSLYYELINQLNRQYYNHCSIDISINDSSLLQSAKKKGTQTLPRNVSSIRIKYRSPSSSQGTVNTLELGRKA